MNSATYASANSHGLASYIINSYSRINYENSATYANANTHDLALYVTNNHG
jgi:hypothetical protein